MRKTASKKAPIAPNLKPSDIFKCGLHAAITDVITNTKIRRRIARPLENHT